MAFRIGEFVERGWLDTSVKGCVTGEIWLAGRSEPIQVNLQGFPHRDMAGFLMSFTNPTARIDEDAHVLDAEQTGMAGDITAARKVRNIDLENPSAPAPMVNALYIEWFSERNGRVVIESADYLLKTHGPSVWQLSDEDEAERQQRVSEGMLWFMNRVCEIAEQQREQSDELPDAPMDEFEWERLLKDADQRTEFYGEVLERYQDHPDRERLVAREMGWDHLEDLMDADARGLFGKLGGKEVDESDDPQDIADSDDIFDAEGDLCELEEMLDPDREGVDWVRTPQGRIYHPLCLQAMQAYEGLHDQLADLGYLNETRKTDSLHAKIDDMIFSARMLSIKLAGALNGLGYDRDLAFTAGMVVAQLKRAMSHFNEAVWHMDELASKDEQLQQLLQPYQQKLFSVRENMLQQMQRFRSMIHAN